MDFAKTRNRVSKTRNCVSKNEDFCITNDEFCSAARMERLSSADASPLQRVRSRESARVKPSGPRGTHNSVDLAAPTAWELCIKNSELTMDEDEDRIGASRFSPQQPRCNTLGVVAFNPFAYRHGRHRHRVQGSVVWRARRGGAMLYRILRCIYMPALDRSLSLMIAEEDLLRG